MLNGIFPNQYLLKCLLFAFNHMYDQEEGIITVFSFTLLSIPFCPLPFILTPLCTGSHLYLKSFSPIPPPTTKIRKDSLPFLLFQLS